MDNNIYEKYNEMFTYNKNLIEKLTEINKAIKDLESFISNDVKQSDITDINIKKYRNTMEITHENKYSIGYRKIAKLSGLKESKARQIFEHLKQVGIIKTSPKGTKILKFQNGGTNIDKKRA